MLPKDINNITEPVYKRLHREIEDVKESSSAVIEASSITALSDDELNALKVGDVVQKITGEQKHCYVVSYKQEEHGICLTYVDAGYMETVSYDYVDGHWVYNSTDVVEVGSNSDFIEVPYGATFDSLIETGVYNKYIFIKLLNSDNSVRAYGVVSYSYRGSYYWSALLFSNSSRLYQRIDFTTTESTTIESIINTSYELKYKKYYKHRVAINVTKNNVTRAGHMDVISTSDTVISNANQLFNLLQQPNYTGRYNDLALTGSNTVSGKFYMNKYSSVEWEFYAYVLDNGNISEEVYTNTDGTEIVISDTVVEL